jgi:hypothetical protein
MSSGDAHNALVSLGFRDHALKVELLELDKAWAGMPLPSSRTITINASALRSGSSFDRTASRSELGTIAPVTT